MNDAISKQAGISLAWQRGEVWEGKWKPQNLPRVKKITSAKRPGMPGPGEDETCWEEQAARENPGSTDTPGIVEKRGCQLMHILRTQRNLCDEHTAERSRQRRRDPTNSRCTEKPGASGMVGRLSRFQAFYKDTLHEHRAAWFGVTPRAEVAGTKKDLSRKRWIPSLLPWCSSLPPCYMAKKPILQRQGLISVKRPKELQENRKSKGRIRALFSFGQGWKERQPPWGHARHRDTHKGNRKGKKNGLVQSPNQVTCWFSPVMCSPDLQAMSTSFSKSVWKTENTEGVVKRGWWRTGKPGKCKTPTLISEVGTAFARIVEERGSAWSFKHGKHTRFFYLLAFEFYHLIKLEHCFPTGIHLLIHSLIPGLQIKISCRNTFKHTPKKPGNRFLAQTVLDIALHT